jgi:hypothetical protein
VLPKDLRVAGLLLDDATGALEVAVQPGEIPAVGVTAPVTPSPPEPATQVPAPGAEPAAAGPAPPPPAKPPAPAEAAQDPMAAAIASFIQTRESKAGLGQDLRRLRLELERQQNPIVKFGLLESFIRRAAADLAYDIQKNKTSQALEKEEVQIAVVEKEQQIVVQEREILRRERRRPRGRRVWPGRT